MALNDVQKNRQNMISASLGERIASLRSLDRKVDDALRELSNFCTAHWNEKEIALVAHAVRGLAAKIRDAEPMVNGGLADIIMHADKARDDVARAGTFDVRPGSGAFPGDLMRA